MSFILPVLAIFTGIGLFVLGAFKRPRRGGRMLLGASMVIVPVLEGSRMAYNFGDPDDWAYSLDFERVPR